MGALVVIIVIIMITMIIMIVVIIVVVLIIMVIMNEAEATHFLKERGGCGLTPPPILN